MSIILYKIISLSNSIPKIISEYFYYKRILYEN